MSRAAEWRAEQLARQGKLKRPPPVEEIKERKNMVPMMTTNNMFNINPLIVENIKQNRYFQSLHSTNLFNDLVDQIYYKVDHVEPWSATSVRTASFCFCLLYKLLLTKVTRKQMLNLLNHEDSPYIRAVGFLYLRFTCPPEDLWSWFEPYINDSEEFAHTHNKSVLTTIGEWIQTLINEQKYFATILPRLPTKLQQELMVKIVRKKEEGVRAKENEQLRNQFKEGMVVKAIYSEDSQWYDARIEKVYENGSFFVTYLPEDEYGNQETVSIGCLELIRESKHQKPRYRSSSRTRNRSHNRRRRSGSRNRRRKYRSSSRRNSRRRRSNSRSGTTNRRQPSDKEILNQLMEKQRNKHSTSGRDFASSRVLSLKGAIQMDHGHKVKSSKRSRSPPSSRRQAKSASEYVANRLKESESQNTVKEIDPMKAAQRKAEMDLIKAKYGDASSKRKE